MKLAPIRSAYGARLLAMAAAANFGALALATPIEDGVANSAAEAKPLGVGVNAPDASLRGLDGKPNSLHEVLDGKPTVLVFYRGGWCPFCNANLSDLATVVGEIRSRGYQLLAISPDTPEELNKTLVKDHLTYKLFSDSSAETMKRFGVAFRLDDPTFIKYRDSYHHDLEAASGEKHHIIPVPSVFVIDKTGKIVFVHSNPDYKVRLKGKEILTAIDAL